MRLIKKKQVYKKGNVVLTEKTFVSQDKELTRVSLSLGKNAVLIVPIDSKNNFYLTKQKRGGGKNFVLEFPSGGIENGEDKLEAAKRELSEELGLEGKMILLGKMRPFFTLVDLDVYVFLCQNSIEQDKDKKVKQEFYEDIKKESLAEKELYDLIRKGEICDSYTLCALSMFKAYKSDN